MRASIITFFLMVRVLRHAIRYLFIFFSIYCAPRFGTFDVCLICGIIKSVGPQNKYGAFRGRMQTRKANKPHLSATGVVKIAAAPNWQKRDALIPTEQMNWGPDRKKQDVLFIVMIVPRYPASQEILHVFLLRR